jgi:DNA-directed RNA polymerase specialized sigma24 family protein
VGFPETSSKLLAEAAGGDWPRFFAEYLGPCWHEVVCACRQKGLALNNADDLFQELVLRLMRQGSGRLLNRGNPVVAAPQGNLPARYLENRKRGENTARFRTYLKGVIRNLIQEALRKVKRQPQPLGLEEGGPLEPWVDSSISVSVDRLVITQGIRLAAESLCRAGQGLDRGPGSRLFPVLYAKLVRGEADAVVAERLGVDRTTVSHDYRVARERFLELLSEFTGIEDMADLKELVGKDPAQLIVGLEKAREAFQVPL